MEILEVGRMSHGNSGVFNRTKNYLTDQNANGSICGCGDRNQLYSKNIYGCRVAQWQSTGVGAVSPAHYGGSSPFTATIAAA